MLWCLCNVYMCGSVFHSNVMLIGIYSYVKYKTNAELPYTKYQTCSAHYMTQIKETLLLSNPLLIMDDSYLERESDSFVMSAGLNQFLFALLTYGFIAHAQVFQCLVLEQHFSKCRSSFDSNWVTRQVQLL